MLAFLIYIPVMSFLCLGTPYKTALFVPALGSTRSTIPFVGFFSTMSFGRTARVLLIPTPRVRLERNILAVFKSSI